MNVRDVSRKVSGGVEVNITVSPNSDTQGTHGTDEWRKRLIVKVRSPPLEGKANKEVEKFMEKITGRRSEVIKGLTDRRKTVMIYGDPEEILTSLEGKV